MKEKVNELENSMYFWQKLDTLIVSGKMEIIGRAGQPSKDYPRLRYPVDFCRISEGPSSMPLYCFRGSLKSGSATAVIVQADILCREVLTKALVGCTEQECALILKFINAAEFQKAILVRRGDEVPAWSASEQ